MFVLAPAWAVLGVTFVVAAMLVRRSDRAHRVAIAALALLYLPAGAGAHLWFLVSDTSYSGFADGSAFAFVTDTWESLVVPNTWIFIGLLTAFEATVGVLVLLSGRPRQVGLWLIAAFHVALVSFSWWLLVWSVPMLTGLALLLRGEREGAVPRSRPAHRRSRRLAGV